MNGINRRDFVTLGAMAGGLIVYGGCAAASARAAAGRILFGACRPFEDAGMMREAGYDFVESRASEALLPEKSEEEWRKRRDLIRALPLPLRACNGFLPGRFRITGPSAAWDEPLAYAETLCRRADEAGVKYLVFGSGAARNVPSAYRAGGRVDGWPVEAGRDQFVEFCRRLASRIAGCGVSVLVEPLRPNESNVVNYVWQAAQVAEEVASPRIRVAADFFHMSMGRESPRALACAARLIGHCHVAMPGSRLAPGLGAPCGIPAYMSALQEAGYTGGVSIEARWGSFEKGKTPEEKRTAFADALALMKEWSKQT